MKYYLANDQSSKGRRYLGKSGRLTRNSLSKRIFPNSREAHIARRKHTSKNLTVHSMWG